MSLNEAEASKLVILNQALATAPKRYREIFELLKSPYLNPLSADLQAIVEEMKRLFKKHNADVPSVIQDLRANENKLIKHAGWSLEWNYNEYGKKQSID